MQYVIIDKMKSHALRQEFIDQFINTATDYYRKHIATLKRCSDGLCYNGYLWDCLKEEFSGPKVHPMRDALALLRSKGEIYVLWDLYSHDRVFDEAQLSVQNPKGTILRVNGSALADRADHEWSLLSREGRLLPEDIYCFDDSFTWFVILTHEEAASALDTSGQNDSCVRLCFVHEG